MVNHGEIFMQRNDGYVVYAGICADRFPTGFPGDCGMGNVAGAYTMDTAGFHLLLMGKGAAPLQPFWAKQVG